MKKIFITIYKKIYLINIPVVPVPNFLLSYRCIAPVSAPVPKNVPVPLSSLGAFA